MIKIAGRVLVLAIIILIFFLISAASSSESRGLKASYKNSAGEVENVQMYSEGRHALVIGVSAYRSGWPYLPNPVKDAREIADMFKKRGWSVDLLSNPDSNKLNRALNKLAAGPGRKIDSAVLLWFSGHGYTLEEADGSKLGYLVPADAPDPDKDLAGFMDKAISMRKIETTSKHIMSRHVLMIFDSCFSGAIFQLVRAKPSPYIETKIKHPVRAFITAGMENEKVPDKSIFKDIFIQGLSEGYGDVNRDSFITGEELGYYLQEKVINYSRKRQHPQFGKINNPRLDKGDMIFKVIDLISKISIQCNVGDADIYISGNKVDETPVKGKTLLPGIYSIKIEKEGYYPYIKTVTLKPDKHLKLKTRLIPKKAKKKFREPRHKIIKKELKKKEIIEEKTEVRKENKKKFYPMPSF